MELGNKKAIIVTSLIGAVVIGGIAILARRLAKRKALERSLQGVSPNVSKISAPGYDGGPLISWPLKNGSGYLSSSERSAVKDVQKYLNRKMLESTRYNLATLTVDGYFGSKTEKALSDILGVRQVSYTLYGQMNEYLDKNSLGGPTYITIDES